MKNRTFICFVLICSAIAHADDKLDRKLTVDQAKALVRMTVPLKQRQLPGFTIISGKDAGSNSDYDPFAPKFFFFNVIWDGIGSVELGLYDVDPYTGDVFYVMGVAENDCSITIKNRQLEALQRQYRRNILHLTAAAYQNLRIKGPTCEK